MLPTMRWPLFTISLLAKCTQERWKQLGSLPNSTACYFTAGYAPGLLRVVSPRDRELHEHVVEDDVFNSAVELQPSSESIEVCLGSTVEVNCTTFTIDLYWETTPECFFSYDSGNIVGLVGMFCDFEVILLSTSPSLMSTAALNNVNSSHNGTVLTCINTILPNPGADQMASVRIFVRGN